MKTDYENLRDLRESLYHHSLTFVSRHASIPVERLARIEAGEPASLDELERLAELYGLDAEQLEEEPVVLASGDSIRALPNLDEFRELGELARSRVIQAARAARDLIRLENLQNPDGPSRAQRFLHEAPRLRKPTRGAAAHRQGAQLAQSLRRELELGSDPIPSMRGLVARHFPTIAVLYADLTLGGPAGLAFADNHRGPAIVLNTRGKNENPTVRRFSLAHELCHILFDWNRMEPIARISGYLHESRLEEERRANAFAIRLLCPETVVHGLEVGALDALGRAREVAEYGIPYSAIRIYLENEAATELPLRPPSDVQRLSVDARWMAAEQDESLADFPLDKVPSERRTQVARLAALLYSEGKLPRDAFAEYLGVTPAQELERVLDFFELPWPEDVEDPFHAA
ncbi:hypothetical protein ENSA5_65120 [Enhygromyxa salina]|uniref:HTH cro/C1-type domain-containing protein n=1 Tax=Enhygromyxa salina TaxID=215803 RepID=A0A2S9XC91_9BACT|nr:ImmA/IrrE family metallo-endopeptidase [Enhygromyxa salina]PRP90420.1 hypothetical protein ENSA5_65120 [Enhygromyxa salina]